MSSEPKARHFPVQQREPTRSRGDGLAGDRSAVLQLCGFCAIASIVYAIGAPFIGPLPTAGWVALTVVTLSANIAFGAAYVGALGFAIYLTIIGVWVTAALQLIVAGRHAPTAELFTITVVFAALAAGRRVAVAVSAFSLTTILLGWWLVPEGIDPVAGGLMWQRRPMIDLELLVFGSAIALWWSTRTERTAREHEVLAGNAQILETLRAAVASSRSGVAIADVRGIVTYANRALLEMWRLTSPDQAIGQSVFGFWAEPEAEEALRRLSNGEELATMLRAKRPDGTEFDVEVSGSRIVGADGRVDGFIASCIDVTERNLAEEQLHFERERTRAIVESVLDIVVILNAEGTIIFENAAVERVLGFRAGERVGQPILMHAHPEDVARAGASMGELLDDPSKLVRMTIRFRHKDGSWRWLETFGRNLMHVPAIGGVLGVGRDVTEQREMQSRLDAAERLETVGRLAGGIAHDFNNLLTAILGNTELAKELPESTGAMARYLDGVTQAGARAKDLTRKLLAFARREITQPVVIDVRDRLIEARDLLHRILGEDITLRVETGPHPLPVLIDPVQFEQVILNVAVNARDAMPNGGTFSIHGELVQVHRIEPTFVGRMSPGPAVHLTLKDAGEGMTPDVAARVFEPFFTTKELGRGTGLGLSTVYGSVAQAGGAIRVTSQVGVGTTFELLLPTADGPAAAAAEHRALPTTTQSAVVLVAEDDPSVREFMVEVLERCGCRVLQAVDGLAGSAVVDAHGHEIDLLVTDVVMPNRNGLDLAAYFRRKRSTGAVLLVTGYSKDPTIEAQAAQLQALVLLKPFTMEQLSDHVSRLLRQPVGR